MKDIKQLFEDRQKEFDATTDVIMSELDHVTEGVHIFFDESDELNNGTIHWEDVSLLSAETPDGHDHIILTAVVEYPVGTKFTLPSKDVVEITEGNADLFQRVLRVGIPLAIAIHGGIDDIVRFMHRAELFAEDEEPEHEDEPERSHVKKRYEFDLSELTDDQVRSLQAHKNKAGDKH